VLNTAVNSSKLAEITCITKTRRGLETACAFEASSVSSVNDGGIKLKPLPIEKLKMAFHLTGKLFQNTCPLA
jgi:hypothetical protein